MGKHSSKKKQRRKRRHAAQSVDGPKLLKYAALGKARRIRSAITESPSLVDYKDPGSGNTALHQVCTAATSSGRCERVTAPACKQALGRATQPPHECSAAHASTAGTPHCTAPMAARMSTLKTPDSRIVASGAVYAVAG
jgi:hypothetical protein